MADEEIEDMEEDKMDEEKVVDTCIPKHRDEGIDAPTKPLKPTLKAYGLSRLSAKKSEHLS